MTNSNPPTLREVAERAGVHVTTASRALNPATSSLVRASTIRRVQAAARELRYRPNAIARGLKTARSMSVGMLLPDLTNPLFPPIVRGLEDRLAAAGYVALIGNTDGDGERERMVFEQMRARHADGIVLATAHLSDPLLAEASRTGLPVVLINRMAQDHSLPSVSVDNESGMRMAVAHHADAWHAGWHVHALDSPRGPAPRRLPARFQRDVPVDPLVRRCLDWHRPCSPRRRAPGHSPTGSSYRQHGVPAHPTS